MEKINVMLYGGWDKKEKNRAEIIYCDKCEVCSFYKNGKCLNVAQPFSTRCKYGKVHVVTGFTQRAAKRCIFDREHKSDPLYGKLNYPSDWCVAIIGDEVALNLIYVICDKQSYSYAYNRWEDTKEYHVRDSRLRVGTISYVPINELNADLINRILKYQAHGFMGEINEYRNKIVPNVLWELKNKLPDKYDLLMVKYPEFEQMSPNFVGKKAYIKSLPDGFRIDDRGTFVKKGNHLICDSYKSAFLPFSSEHAYVEIEITDKMIYQIQKNSEVDENTVFA